MSQNSVSSVILRFSLDESAQRRVVKGISDVEAALNKTTKVTRTVESAAEGLNAEFARLARAKSIDKIEAAAISAGKKTDDWYASLKMVSEELAKIGATDAELTSVGNTIGRAAAGEGGGRRQAGSLGRLGREVKALPAIAISGNLSTDAIGKILYTADAGLSALGATAAQVGAASAIAAPALIGVVVAMASYNKQIELQKAALTGALSAQDRYYTALGNFSSEQAAKELETETRRLENLRQQRAETQNALDSAFRQAQAAFTDPVARALDAGGQLPTAQLRDQLKELDAQIASTAGYTTRLGDGIRNLEFASRDAADAVADAIAQQEKFQQIQTRVQLNEVQLQVRASQMTADARAKRQTEIQAEISILEQARSSTTLTWQAQSELNAQITALRTESEILRRTFSSTADAAAELASRTAAIEEQTTNYFKATEATTKAQEALTKAQQDAQKVYDDYMAKSLEISTQTAEKEREILADGGDKRADIERRTQDAIAKTMRDYGREQFNAVAERDALAAYQAKQRAEDQQSDEQKARADAIKEQEKAQAKALASLQSSVNQQTRTLETSYRNQQALAANAALRAQIDLQNAKASEIAIAANGANGMRSIHSFMWGELTTVAVNGVQAILTQTRRLVGGMGGTDMYVNGLNEGVPAAYDLYGVGTSTRTTTQAVFGAVDQRLNQYFRTTGITRD